MADRPAEILRSETASAAAARWALRCADGLAPEQEAELAAWLASDPHHAALLAEHQRAWDRFTPLAVEVTGSGESSRAPAPPRAPARLLRFALPALAAAAVVLGIWLRPAAPRATPAALASRPSLPSPCEKRTLPDGTKVELNRGAEIAVEFGAELRRVRLVRGEASFAVAKDPLRPFAVVAGAVEARVLGTVFNVRRESSVVEVLVTEGVVRVQEPDVAALPAAPAAPEPRLTPAVLTAGQHAVLAVDSPVVAPRVATLSSAEIDRRLAWQPRLLEFDDAPLTEIVAAFNRHNPVRFQVPDPALAARRMTATFRSDNVEGFVRLLESSYAIHARAEANGVISFRER